MPVPWILWVMVQWKMAGCIWKGNDESSEMYFTKFSRNSQDQFQDQGRETPLKTCLMQIK